MLKNDAVYVMVFFLWTVCCGGDGGVITIVGRLIAWVLAAPVIKVYPPVPSISIKEASRHEIYSI